MMANHDSFNCNGVKNKLLIIAELCQNADTVLLHETWLLPVDLPLMNSVHKEYNDFSISSVDLGELLSGRPFGGLSLLLHKNLENCCQVLSFEDNRILGLTVKTRDRDLLILNVYLPYDCNDNFDDYILYIGKISSIIEEYKSNEVMIIGDFNAKPSSEYYSEWLAASEQYNLIFSDVNLLCPHTYTHINNANLSKTWLDHCLSSQSVHRSILNISVDENYFGSDHLPLKILLRYNMLPNIVAESAAKRRIKWNFNDTRRKNQFVEAVNSELSNRLTEIPICLTPNCSNEAHLVDLDTFWETFGTQVPNKLITPGLNSYVKHLYKAFRIFFMEKYRFS